MSEKDKQILRELAKHFAGLCATPEMEEKRQRWYDQNELKPGKPLVHLSPEGCWPELVGQGDLLCEDSTARTMEMQLRMSICRIEFIADDSAIEPEYKVWFPFGFTDYGFEIQQTHGENRGSFVWEAPIKDLDADFHKLKYMETIIGYEERAQLTEAAHDVFDGILGVVNRPGIGAWSVGRTHDAIRLMGMAEFFMAMYENPDGVHKLMRLITDSYHRFLDFMEESGEFMMNVTDGFVGSGGLAYTRKLPQPDWKQGMNLRTVDMWGFAESQETVGVSPKMFHEFIFPYQMELLKRFRMNCYGCCEPVHERLDDIMTIPNLVRVSVSPWCNEELAAEAFKGKVIFSRKPNPTMIATGFFEHDIREDLRHTLKVAKGCNLEIIMKDTHTVQNCPDRVREWVRIAKEEVDKVY